MANLFNKIIRKKLIMAEIKLKEQEYVRLSLQINELEKSMDRLMQEAKDGLKEFEELSEWIDNHEYESIKKN